MTVESIQEKIKSRGYWEIEIRPSKFKENNITLAQCTDLIVKCQVRHRGWYYPSFGNKKQEFYTGNDCQVGLCDWQDHVEVWKFFQSGLFIHHLGLWEDYMAEYRGLFGNTDSRAKEFPPGTMLEVVSALYTLTEVFLFAARLAENKVFESNLIISIKLHNTKNRKLRILEGFRDLFDDYTCQINSIELKDKIINVDELLKNYSRIALDTTLEIFDRFNWKYNEEQIRQVLSKDQDNFFKMKF